jgi:hypothetical protein
MGRSWKSARERELFPRRSGARCTTAITAAGFRAAGCRLAKAITSATGPRADPPYSRTSRCSAGAITAPSTRRAIRWNDSPMASCGSGDRTDDFCQTFRLRPRSPPIPSMHSERGMKQRGFTCTRGRRARAGWGNGSTSAGHSTSCTREPSSRLRSASKPSKPWRSSADAPEAQTMTGASSPVAIEALGADAVPGDKHGPGASTPAVHRRRPASE